MATTDMTVRIHRTKGEPVGSSPRPSCFHRSRSKPNMSAWQLEKPEAVPSQRYLPARSTR